MFGLIGAEVKLEYMSGKLIGEYQRLYACGSELGISISESQLVGITHPHNVVANKRAMVFSIKHSTDSVVVISSVIFSHLHRTRHCDIIYWFIVTCFCYVSCYIWKPIKLQGKIVYMYCLASKSNCSGKLINSSDESNLYTKTKGERAACVAILQSKSFRKHTPESPK